MISVEMRFFLRPLVLVAIVSSPAPAISQACPDLETTDKRAFSADQYAATTMGPSPKVDAPSRHLAIPTGSLKSVRIKLERTQCYGRCPSYSVELDGDGTASYDGGAFTLVPAHHSFTVPQTSVECLLSYFKKADFWSLPNEYVADITDGSSYTLTFTIGDESKSVVDYFGSVVGLPPLVTAIEDEIDRVGADRWVKGNAETLPSLRAEHFDFHSREAATLLANATDSAPDDLVAGLIDAGAPATGRRSTPWKGIEGATAIATASYAGRLSIVRWLIAKGALSDTSPDVKDDALRSAASSGDPLIVTEILKFHPDVNAKDRQGNTSLILMWTGRPSRQGEMKRDLLDVARELVAAGADPNVANKDGNTALFSASDADVVRLLVKAGATIDVRDKFGSTPLLSANSDEAAVALIVAGADVSIKDRFGNDIEKEAARRHFSKTAQMLRERAAHQ